MNIYYQQFFLYEYQIESIKNEVTEDIKADTAQKVLDAVTKCFKEWQLAHGVKPVFGGFLSNKPSEVISLEDVDKFKPWQCAGFGINNYIDLAFKLWTEEYKPFDALKNEFGLHLIFAVLLGQIDTKAVQQSNSIFRAYDFILHYRKWLLEAKYELLINKTEDKKQKQNKQIQEARQIAAYNKIAKSNEYKRLWNQWALETKHNNPFWTNQKIVEHVCLTAKRYDHKMANGKLYKSATIYKYISWKNLPTMVSDTKF